MNNIAEGFSRRSNKEFVQFLFISKGSAAEVQSMFADKTARLISNFIKYLRKSN